MNLVMLTAVARVIIYLLALGGLFAWRRGRGTDWLAVAVLLSGVAIATLAGLQTARGLEGLLRTPVTLLVCAYVLLRQRANPS